MGAPESFGYGGTGYSAAPYVPAPSYAYSAPSRSNYYAPVPAYTPPAPSYYAEQAPTRAVVTLPRLGLSFTLGGNNGMLANRTAPANRIASPPSPSYDAPVAPPLPPQGRPDQYRYDGGPSNP